MSNKIFYSVSRSTKLPPGREAFFRFEKTSGHISVTDIKKSFSELVVTWPSRQRRNGEGPEKCVTHKNRRPLRNRHCLWETATWDEAQAGNQLGTLGEAEFERGPNFLNYVQHIFPGGGKKFCASLVTGLMKSTWPRSRVPRTQDEKRYLGHLVPISLLFRSERTGGTRAKVRALAASNNRDLTRHDHSSRTPAVTFNRSHVSIGRDYTPQSLYYCLFAPHVYAPSQESRQ